MNPRPRLDRSLFPRTDTLPERVLQFGEGNFLRAFVDWQIGEMNKRRLFLGSVVVVQPIERGTVETLNGQDGLFTLIQRGLVEGKPVERREVIPVIRRGIDPYARWAEFLECARQPEIRFIFSNTTEAGIAHVPVPFPVGACPAPFPAKLAAFLFERYRHFGADSERGLLVFPCELIERNGRALKECVIRNARDWGLEDGFFDWLGRHNHFYDTLVDRIVSGFPENDAETLRSELGYEDALMVCSEIYHFWAIQGDQAARGELPLLEAGLNVRWTEDLTPFRTLKVRILNGAHTLMAVPAILAGRETVRQCLQDPLVGAYLRAAIYREIVPTLDMPEPEIKAYAGTVFERLANPFINHRLASIALNSVAKFRLRVLPSLLEYRERKRAIPPLSAFSLAALIVFYKGVRQDERRLLGTASPKGHVVEDEPKVLAKFVQAHASSDPETACRDILGDKELWGIDLLKVAGLADQVRRYQSDILIRGAEEAMRRAVAAGVKT